MSDDYDNTDRGAAFVPFPNQKFILQGKIDNQGNEERIVLIRTESRSGEPMIEVYQKVGVLFPNKSDNENAPHYTGPMYDNARRIAAWKKQKDGKNYMTISLSNYESQNSNEESEVSKRDLNDKIPF